MLFVCIILLVIVRQICREAFSCCEFTYFVNKMIDSRNISMRVVQLSSFILIFKTMTATDYERTGTFLKVFLFFFRRRISALPV